jgi:hypothetical protein
MTAATIVMAEGEEDIKRLSASIKKLKAGEPHQLGRLGTFTSK